MRNIGLYCITSLLTLGLASGCQLGRLPPKLNEVADLQEPLEELADLRDLMEKVAALQPDLEAVAQLAGRNPSTGRLNDSQSQSTP